MHIIFSGLIFSFLLKGLRTRVWRPRDINIGGKNPTDISFENIGNQIIFLGKIKYFQQSLNVLANSLTDTEKSAFSRVCETFIKKDENLARRFNSKRKRNNNGF